MILALNHLNFLIMINNISKYFKVIALLLIIAIVFLSFPNLCDGHDHDHIHEHHHHHDEPPAFKYSQEANSKLGATPKTKKVMSTSSIWSEALSSTIIISIAPFIILYFIPLNNRREHGSFLKILLSFASGGLLGDAFLHLIPHALMPHSHHDGHHSHSHEHIHDNNIGLWVLSGILAFLVIEKSVRLIKGEHSHSHLDDSDDKSRDENDRDKSDEKDKLSEDDNKDSESEEEIKVAGYLNLAADFTHNFTDGLAIGASYLAGRTVGWVTTITILFHEIPHEIGDFAILVQSGCSKKKVSQIFPRKIKLTCIFRQAMLLQLITAIGAISGTLVSLISGGIDASTTSWVLPFTAGGFIYIATVSIIPDLLTDTKFVQSIKEIAALLIGVSMMVIVSQFE